MRPSGSRVFCRSYCAIAAGYRDGSGVLPYDRAAERALSARHKPPTEGAIGSAERTLFVGRLRQDIDESTLSKVFCRFGAVEGVRIVCDIVTGQSRGYAFVVFETRRDADRAWEDGHTLCIQGCDVVVEREFGRSMRNWVPRKLGGGLGGRKESGQLRFGGSARPFVSAPDWQRRASTHATDIAAFRPECRAGEDGGGPRWRDKRWARCGDRECVRRRDGAAAAGDRDERRYEPRSLSQERRHPRAVHTQPGSPAVDYSSGCASFTAPRDSGTRARMSQEEDRNDSDDTDSRASLSKREKRKRSHKKSSHKIKKEHKNKKKHKRSRGGA